MNGGFWSGRAEGNHEREESIRSVERVIMRSASSGRRSGWGRRIQRALLALGLGVLTGHGVAQDPGFVWALGAGSPLDDISQDLAIDPTGGICVTGHFQGSVKFGDQTVSTAGEMFYLARLNAGGGVQWVRQGTGVGRAEGRGVAVNAGGEIYAAGLLRGEVDFGGVTLQSVEAGDGFLAKFRSDGGLVWARRFGGSSSSETEYGSRVAIAPNGDCLVVGEYDGAADFGGVTLPDAGVYATFVARFRPDGSVAWVRPVAAGLPGTRRGVAVDPAGNILVGGDFRGSLTLGSQTVDARGYGNVFVAKFDPAGNPLWVTAAGGDDPQRSDGLGAVAVDREGNVVSCGEYYGEGIFGTNRIHAAANTSMFVMKHDPAGKLQWVRTGDSVQGVNANSVACGPDGSVFATGNYLDTGTFGGVRLPNGNHADLFVVKYSPDGRQQWVLPAAGQAYSNGTGIRVDPSGGVFVGGYIRGSSPVGSLYVTGAGLRDVLAVRVQDPPAPRLQVSPGSGGVVVSWPLPAVGFRLESTFTSDPGFGGWQRVTNAVRALGDRNVVTHPATDPSRLFRLQRP